MSAAPLVWLILDTLQARAEVSSSWSLSQEPLRKIFSPEHLCCPHQTFTFKVTASCLGRVRCTHLVGAACVPLCLKPDKNCSWRLVT
ncbi:hypothetical protein E2C01_070169 [Portunus trituberculatus]|uniref:Secreted protein n=1 Tax=Portunus trituberculatus TaxID=210409 RepID=A0A5B7I4R0_PORTR|nr:hypothetical protein [Portunus trituberculatus]